MLPNPRHERFAQALAAGESKDAAYVTAGYKASRGNASRLSAKDNIQARVREIQERGQERTMITLETMTQRHNDAINAAANDGAHPAVMAGLHNLAKLHGLIVDKSKVEHTEIDKMSEDELAKDIEQTLRRLGRDAGSSQKAKGARTKAPSE